MVPPTLLPRSPTVALLSALYLPSCPGQHKVPRECRRIQMRLTAALTGEAGVSEHVHVHMSTNRKWTKEEGRRKKEEGATLR